MTRPPTMAVLLAQLRQVCEEAAAAETARADSSEQEVEDDPAECIED